MDINILPTDKAFKDSPDAGLPECVCSRCGKVITEEDAPAIRAWLDSGEYEYRYHVKCIFPNAAISEVKNLLARKSQDAAQK